MPTTGGSLCTTRTNSSLNKTETSNAITHIVRQKLWSLEPLCPFSTPRQSASYYLDTPVNMAPQTSYTYFRTIIISHLGTLQSNFCKVVRTISYIKEI